MALKPLFSTSVDTKNGRLKPLFSANERILPETDIVQPTERTLSSGRGQFLAIPGQRETLITAERGYGTFAPKAGQERDHIIPVWAGGTSNDANIQYLEGANWWDRTFVKDPFKQKSRQQGKMVVELKAREDYERGLISLNEARLRILNWDKVPPPFLKILGKEFLNPETYKKTGSAVVDFFKGIGEKVTARGAEGVGLFTRAIPEAMKALVSGGKEVVTKAIPATIDAFIQGQKERGAKLFTEAITGSLGMVGERFVAPGAKSEIGAIKGLTRFMEWASAPGAARGYKTFGDKLQKWEDAIEVKNPEGFIEQLGGGVGSQAVFFLPGLGAMKFAKIISQYTPAITMTIGATTSAFLESAAEAGDTYDTSLKLNPGDTGLASDRATFVFNSNMVLNFLTNRLGIFSNAGKTALGKILVGVPEAVQEFYQQLVQNKAFNKPWDEGTLRAGLIGGIIGFFTGGIGGISPTIITPEIQEELEQIPEYPNFKPKYPPPPPPPPDGDDGAVLEYTPRQEEIGIEARGISEDLNRKAVTEEEAKGRLTELEREFKEEEAKKKPISAEEAKEDLIDAVYQSLKNMQKETNFERGGAPVEDFGQAQEIFEKIEKKIITHDELLQGVEILKRNGIDVNEEIYGIISPSKQFESSAQSKGRKIFRTKKAHEAYKNIGNLGEGLYFGTDKQMTGNMIYGMTEYLTGKSNKEVMHGSGLRWKRIWKPEEGGVETHTIPSDTRLLKIHFDIPSGFKYPQFVENATGKTLKFSPNELKEYAISRGYDGVELTQKFRDEIPQIVIYNKNVLKTGRPEFRKKESGLADLFLKYAKGKTILSRQEIMDFARRPELKKGEADLLLKKLEEFEPTYHGTYDKEFVLEDKPIFLTKDFDEAATYAGGGFEWRGMKREGDVKEFLARKGNAIDLNETENVKKIFQEIQGSPQLKKTFNSIPENYQYLDRDGSVEVLNPRKNVNDFDDWLALEYQSNPKIGRDGLRVRTGSYSFDEPSKEIRRKLYDAFQTYGQPTRQSVYNNWEKIIAWAKKKGYDYIEHTTESPDASITFPEKIALNPKKSLIESSKIPAQEFADSIRRDLFELKPAIVKRPQLRRKIVEQGMYTRLVSHKEARERTRKILKNVGIEGISLELVDTIFTGETTKDGKRQEAWAVTFDNTITFTDWVSEFTGEHESMHIIFRNLENIPLFKGISKQDILEELQTKHPDTPITELEERLAEDFELYVEKQMKKEEAEKTLGKKITEFFQELIKGLRDIFGLGGQINAIDELYRRTYYGKAQESIKLKHKGTLIKFRKKEDDKIVLDFTKDVKDRIDSAIFKVSKEVKNPLLVGIEQEIKKRIARKAPATKVGIRLHKVMRDRTIKNRIKTRQIIDSIRDKNVAIERVRKDVYEFIRNALPQKSRGKMLALVANAQTKGSTARALRMVIKESNRLRQKELIDSIKDTLENVDKLPLRYQFMIGERLKNLSSVAMTEETRRKLISLRDLVSSNPQIVAEFGSDGVRDLHRLGELEATPLRELPILELAQIADDVMVFANEGKIWDEIMEERKERELEKTLVELKMSSTNVDKITPRVYAREMTKEEEKEQRKGHILQGIQDGKMDFFSVDIGFEMLDGDKRMGTNWQTFKKPIDKSIDASSDVTADFVSHYFKHKVGIEKQHGITFKRYNMERIFIYATKMQQGGHEKLQKSGIPDAVINSIELNPAEMDLYRYFRINFDILRPAIDSTLQQVYNRKLNEVNNYFSWQTDFENSNEVYERLESDYNLTSRTAQGFTKGRTGGRQSLKLNAEEVYLKHAKDAIYFLNIEATLHHVGQIARSPQYAEAVGKSGQRWVMGYIDLMARKGVPKGWKPNLITKALNNIGAGILGFKLSPILKQPIAKITSGSLLGKHTFIHDFEFYGNNLRPQIHQASKQQKFRNFDDPAYTELEKTGKLAEWQKRGYYFIKAVDGYTADSVWYAAYHKWHEDSGMQFNMDAFKGGHFEEDAVIYSDYVVRRTQGSSEAKDLPRMLTGEHKNFWRSLFKFQSFVMNESYLVLYDLPKGIKNKNFGEVSAITVAVLASGLAESYIQSALTGIFAGDDEKKKEEFEQGFWDRIIDSLASRMPLVNNIYGAMKYDSSGVALFDTYLNTIKGAKTIVTGKEPSTKIKGGIKAMESAGSLFGISGSSQTGQILRLILSEFDEEDKSQRILNHMESLSPDDAADAWNTLREEDVDMADKIATIKEEKDLGITTEDKSLKSLGVKNGERAKEILKELQELNIEEEKANLWDEYERKKIITKDVAEQLNALIGE